MKKILLLLIFGILLIGTVSAAEWDNVKSYNDETKTITIKNSFLFIPTSTIATATLDTPQIYRVGAGYGKIAQFTVNPSNDYSTFITELDLYNIKDGTQFQRQVDVKYSTIEQVVVNEYAEKNCVFSKNGTQVCEKVIVGSYTEDREVWVSFDNTIKIDEPLTIGLFTEVEVGDNVEWIPTLAGVRVPEWAVWTAALNTNLTHYYPYEYVNSTWSGTNNSIDGNWDKRILNHTNGASLVSGIIGDGLLLQYGNYTSSVNVTNYNHSWSDNFWANHNWTNGVNNLIYQLSSSIGGGETDLIINNMGNGTIQFDGAGLLRGNVTVQNSTATMYTVTSNSTWFWVYVNDTLAFADARTTVDLSTRYLDMPRRDVSGQSIWYDEHGHWNRTLTAAEVTQLYNGGAGMTYIGGVEADLMLPVNDSHFITTAINFSVNITDPIPVGVYNVSLLLNGTINQTNSSYATGFYNFSVNVPVGNWNWSVEVYDNSTKRTIPTARTFDIVKLIYTNQSYNSEAAEQSTETFYTNFSVVNGLGVSAVNITYNQTNYSATFSSINSSSYEATATLTTPTVNTHTNMTFNWTVQLTDDSFHISDSNLQEVQNFGIDNCSVNTIAILNLSMVDEDTQVNFLSGANSTSIKIDISLYPNGSLTTPSHTFSTDFDEVLPAAICINASLGTSIFYMDAQIQYNAADYELEYHNIQNYSLNATANPSQNITLYDLNESVSQAFTISYKDSSFLVVGDALIMVQRKYIDEGVFKVVEIPLTDANGEAIAHLVIDDVIYSFTITKDGEVLATFSNVYAVCQNPSITTCKIDFNSFSSTFPVTEFETEKDFAYTLTWDDTTRTVSSTFVIPSGTVSYVALNVSKSDALGTSLCNESITTSSGTLDCVIGNTFGNATVMAHLYKDSSFIGGGNMKLDQSPSDIYGNALVTLGLFLIITLIGAAISSNPVITILLFMVGVILLFALNLVANNGFIGGTATILWLFVAIIILIVRSRGLKT